jgi:hypothetical protein
LAQDAGGFKDDNPPGPEDEILFGLRVAAAPGVFAADAEFAKAADEDIFFPGQGVFDDIQDAFQGAASFLLTEAELEINVINNLFFGQGHGRNSLLEPENVSDSA